MISTFQNQLYIVGTIGILFATFEVILKKNKYINKFLLFRLLDLLQFLLFLHVIDLKLVKDPIVP